ncbi:cytochrome P450 [Nocardia sp. NBC_01503]|uniref:cytochrome P450 n=1 Tax=Nocardia sp. NBC_01503 TaxID=2975997 RepID=UPI002E7B72A4|nr:cytochrome P450 [Nocardia sp. NBC_01503]WTL31483.1 cytochrome P450 [Nocardia sp. NBC_01503]
MRSAHGDLVPVEVAPGVAATLVTGYYAARHILGNPAGFPADPRPGQSDAPTGCPALSLMRWQPNALRAAGDADAVYRNAIAASLDRIDLYALRNTVEHTAVALINRFCEAGTADLLGDYAIPLTVEALEAVLGLSIESGDEAYTAIMLRRDAVDAAAAAQADELLVTVLREVLAAKRVAPAADVASRLLEHATELSDEELAHQAAMLYLTGSEPTWNLIANTLLSMLTDDGFGGELLGGGLSVRDAIDEVLFTDPPIANACISYPRQPQIIGEVWLPEHQPVIISLAACNTDPAVTGDRKGNRSHLAWGAGPRMCPGQAAASVIVEVALDQLLDALPDISLSVDPQQLRWRPDPFHRALTQLPVTFLPAPPLPAPH